MSRWLAEQVQIVLHPRQVQLLRMSRRSTARILDKSVVSCRPIENGEPMWNSALQELDSEFPEFIHGRTEVRVVLSNHFVRYAIFHNNGDITRADEELALAQHQFSRIYGQSSAHWEILLSPAMRFNSPRVACALDRDLLNRLRELCSLQLVSLHSVQPYLAVAFNQYSSRLLPDTWLILVEDGILCLALLKNSRWQSIKTTRIDTNWRQELTSLIQRETLFAGITESETGQTLPMMVIAPDYPEPINISRACNTSGHDCAGMELVLDPSEWPEPIQASGTAQAMAVCA